MQFNTRQSTLFINTRWAFRTAFHETRSMPFWFKEPYVSAEKYTQLHPYSYARDQALFFRDHCPAAILHLRDTWNSINRKRDSYLKTTGHVFALLWSAIIEVPLLAIRNAIIDILTFPFLLVGSLFVDIVDLGLNLVQDIASLPAVAVNAVVNRKSKQPVESPSDEEDYEEGGAPNAHANQEQHSRNTYTSSRTQTQISKEQQAASAPAKSHSWNPFKKS